MIKFLNKKKGRVKMNEEIKQIVYHSWYQELPEEHKDYFGIIDTIASWISNELEAFKMNVIDYDFKYHKFSTICVNQSKEKFGSVRIYITFADERQVKKKFEEEKPNITFEEFSEQCFLKDCQHYRRTYLTAKKLWPQYWKAISSAADHSEFLFETKEEFDKTCEKEKEDWYKKRKENVYAVCGWKS